jgi:hypothetical protein
MSSRNDLVEHVRSIPVNIAEDRFDRPFHGNKVATPFIGRSQHQIVTVQTPGGRDQVAEREVRYITADYHSPFGTTTKGPVC